MKLRNLFRNFIVHLYDPSVDVSPPFSFFTRFPKMNSTGKSRPVEVNNAACMETWLAIQPTHGPPPIWPTASTRLTIDSTVARLCDSRWRLVQAVNRGLVVVIYVAVLPRPYGLGQGVTLHGAQQIAGIHVTGQVGRQVQCK